MYWRPYFIVNVYSGFGGRFLGRQYQAFQLLSQRFFLGSNTEDVLSPVRRYVSSNNLETGWFESDANLAPVNRATHANAGYGGKAGTRSVRSNGEVPDRTPTVKACQ